MRRKPGMDPRMLPATITALPNYATRLSMRRISRKPLWIFSLVILVAVPACEPPEDPAVETEAAAPDTLVQEPGRENARDWCRAFVSEEVDPMMQVTFQEDALVRDFGTGRYEVEGRFVIRDGDARPEHRFRCIMNFSPPAGWLLEQMDIRRIEGE